MSVEKKLIEMIMTRVFVKATSRVALNVVERFLSGRGMAEKRTAGLVLIGRLGM